MKKRHHVDRDASPHSTASSLGCSGYDWVIRGMLVMPRSTLWPVTHARGISGEFFRVLSPAICCEKDTLVCFGHLTHDRRVHTECSIPSKGGITRCSGESSSQAMPSCTLYQLAQGAYTWHTFGGVVFDIHYRWRRGPADHRDKQLSGEKEAPRNGSPLPLSVLTSSSLFWNYPQRRDT